MTQPRVLVFAYACEHSRGSEPGAGWGLVRAVASFAECVVLVGPEHAPALANWTSAHPHETVKFVVVPERRWPRQAGRGRFGWFLSYLRWMENARVTARSIHAERPFDMAYHATYSTYWLPSPVSELGIPSVWGPVGGAVTTPMSLWSLLGWRGALEELFDTMVVRALAALPATRRTARRATVRIVQNEATRDALPQDLRANTRVLNHALFVDGGQSQVQSRGRQLLWASALEARKGAGLALKAMALTPDDVTLVIAGDGPERQRLENMAARAGIASRVIFRGAVPRAELQILFARSAGIVFTGLREEGGLALAEAMLSGAPVIVLANGGATSIAQRGTDPTRITLIQPGSVHDTVRRFAEAMTRAARVSATGAGPTLDRASALSGLRLAFDEALSQSSVPRPLLRISLASDAPIASSHQVAVVIPVYNGARYLRSAALSVLAQTHRALTLVILDDGSTDETLVAAHAIAETDARVIVVHTTNGGRARARNLGVAASPTSAYVAFLDSDDVWDADKLACQLVLMNDSLDAVGIGSFMRYISSVGRVLGETGQTIKQGDHERIARGDLAPFPISSCLMVRRQVFERLGGFDPGLREAEDLDFIARLARVGEIRCAPRALGSYRIHPDSSMARSRSGVNMHARFVRHRLAERDACRESTWQEFEATYRPTWRERRRDAIETWYRSAALWRGEGQRLRSLWFGILAASAAPVYTFRRLHRQVLRGSRTETGNS